MSSSKWSQGGASGEGGGKKKTKRADVDASRKYLCNRWHAAESHLSMDKIGDYERKIYPYMKITAEEMSKDFTVGVIHRIVKATIKTRGIAARHMNLLKRLYNAISRGGRGEDGDKRKTKRTKIDPTRQYLCSRWHAAESELTLDSIRIYERHVYPYLKITAEKMGKDITVGVIRRIVKATIKTPPQGITTHHMNLLERLNKALSPAAQGELDCCRNIQPPELMIALSDQALESDFHE